MTSNRVILLSVCITIGLLPIAGRAHEGHDDGASPASGLPGINVPRVEAQSDLFEIVAVVERDAMKIFLDRYATNEPVIDAKIDIEAGSLKGVAHANPDGTYTFRNPALAQPGQLPITFTIAAGRDSDLLAGDLVIADPDAAAAHANADPWWKGWSWVAGAGVVLTGAVIAWWSRRNRVKGIAK